MELNVAGCRGVGGGLISPRFWAAVALAALRPMCGRDVVEELPMLRVSLRGMALAALVIFRRPPEDGEDPVTRLLKLD